VTTTGRKGSLFRCLIPRFDGAILSLAWKEAAWDRYVHAITRHDHARRPSSNTAIASFATLSRELGINPKTVAKWRKRATVEDLKTGPKAPHSTTLFEAEEAVIVAFRLHTLLPLDDCLYVLQPSIPHLSRSARTAAFSDMAYPVCRTLKVISRSGSASSATRSASST
jgi:hypothetical protein